MDQWMVLKVVLHLLVPLGDRRHSEETIKGALATLIAAVEALDGGEDLRRR